MLVGWGRGGAFASGGSGACKRIADVHLNQQSAIRNLPYFAARLSLEKTLFTIRHSPPYFTSDM
jgi:hypothetical protein